MFNDHTGPILLSSYSLTHIYVHVTSLNPKYETNILFFIFGGPGGPLCRTQVNENFRSVRPHHRADICITRGGGDNCQFFIYNMLFKY